MNVSYGYAKRVDHEWCAVDATRDGLMLCGREVSFVPVVQSAFSPANLHEKCRQAVWGNGLRPPRRDVFAMGVCPECGGSVFLDDGLVVAHGQIVMRGGVQMVSETPCDGKGHRPVEEDAA